MYISIHIHTYEVDTYVYDKIHHEPTMILPVQIQDYRVLNLIHSVLYTYFFFPHGESWFSRTQVIIGIEYSIITQFLYPPLYTQQYQSYNTIILPSSIEK